MSDFFRKINGGALVNMHVGANAFGKKAAKAAAACSVYFLRNSMGISWPRLLFARRAAARSLSSFISSLTDVS
jgi:hypothetical protein